MSKHRNKIIDLIKNEGDTKYATFNNIDRTRLNEIIENNEPISEKEYIEVLSGEHEYISSYYIKGNFEEYFKNLPHNNAITNKKILQNTSGYESYKYVLDSASGFLTEHGVLDNEDIDGFISGKYLPLDDSDNNISSHPDLKSQHLESIAEQDPEEMGNLMKHPKFNDNVLNSLMNKEGFTSKIDSDVVQDILSNRKEGYDHHGDPTGDSQSLNLHPNIVHKLLDKTSNGAHLDVLLDHTDPGVKKQWIDKKLGITDGSYGHTFPEDHSGGIDSDEFKENNWSNWATDQEGRYDKNVAHYLAGSRHIDDDHAEHIKRHSSIDEKYQLYQNHHVDPKHGAEMFQKWHDDHDHHGYDAGELNEYHRKNKRRSYTIDDLDTDTIEEIKEEGYESGVLDEYADEYYSLHDYINDYEDKIVERMGSDYDDVDEMSDILHDRYDWEGDNPESAHNVGNPLFDKLDELHKEYPLDEHSFTVDELKNDHNIDVINDYKIQPDEDGDIDGEELYKELAKYGGPSTIDYLDHDSLTINDHPDFDERYEEEVVDHRKELLRGDKRWEISDDLYLYEDHRDSEGYQNALEESLETYVNDNATEHFDELFSGSHQDTRFVPNHLHAHIPNFNEIKVKERKKNLDGAHKGFLDQSIKDRSYEHSYGENQHHHEMVRDHAEVNGGKIDVGTMNKLFPNQKDTWKKIFNGKGKLTSEEINNKIEEIPKTNYEISYGQWGSSKMQNINGRDQVIMRLGHSDESIKPLMEDQGVYDTYNRVQDTSRRSGHPTKKNTIAWARVDTTDPEHWMIDEIQSDFGKTVQRYLKKEGREDKASHIDTISEHHKNWRENLINHITKEAKKHGAQKISTHSPESKHSHAAYSGSKIHSTYKKGYKQVPRAMGFKPSEHTELPITDRAKEHFVKEDEGIATSSYKLHESAALHHMSMRDAHQVLAGQNPDNFKYHMENNKKHNEILESHYNMMEHYSSARTTNMKYKYEGDDSMSEFAGAIGKAKDSIKNNTMLSHENDHLLEKPPTEFKDKTFQGHTYDLTPKLMKKSIKYAVDLIKKEKIFVESLKKGKFDQKLLLDIKNIRKLI